jgi:microcystin-dependent protein
MPLLLPHSYEGLDAKIRSVIEDIVARVQAWAGQVDGINAAERLNELTTGIAGLPTVPTGAGFVWYTSTAPTGYLICDGSTVSRTTYANLFALFGTTFGAGDGATTFALPDLRRRFPMGKSSSDTLAGTGGTFNHTHTGPSHTHGAGSYTTGTHDHTGVTGTGSNEEERQPGAGAPYDIQNVDHTHTISTQAAMSISGTSGAEGTGNTGTANPPYVVVNWIVKT